MAYALVQPGSIPRDREPAEATLGEVMDAQQAIADAVTADHWVSYHIAVRAAVTLGLTDEQIDAAYQCARRDLPPSFDAPQPCVTRWTGRKSGLTFVHCALCDWNQHGPAREALGQLAAAHRCAR